MRRTLLALLLALLMLASGVTALASPYEEQITFSDASLMVTSGANFEDELYQHLNEMFNFKMEILPLTWDDYTTKPRIWLASGDAPDMFTWDFNYTDYTNYIDQELIEPIPADYAEKYPNLANALGKTSLTEFLKEKHNGELYCIPHVAYMDPPSDPVLQHYVLHYRKDWAEKVGVEVGETITLDELFELAQKFIEEDPGGNGAGNTIGLTSRTGFLNELILGSFNKEFNDFYKNGDSYAWGPADEETLEGLAYFKEQYDAGLIDPDFYTFSGKEFYDKFFAGRSGLMFGEGHGNEQNQIRNDFQMTNPDIDVDDAVGVAVVLANDGKWRGNEQPNYWTATLFRKGIDPQVMDRILAIMDYLSTDEGYWFIRMGVEGKDYQMNGDEINILREKDPDTGVALDIMTIYPSQRVWVFMSILDDQWGLINPELPEELRERVVRNFELKQELGDYRRIDWDAQLFVGPSSDKFTISMNDEAPGLITMPGDLRTNWESWISNNKAMIDRVIQEMNEGILGA